VGLWREEGDSVVLFLTDQQVAEGLAAALAPLAPTLGADSLRALTQSALSGVQTTNLGEQMRGVAEGDRLTLVDVNGRTRVYRRQDR
jgi:hypothetical protein